MELQNLITTILIVLSLAIVCFLLFKTLRENKFRHEIKSTGKKPVNTLSHDSPNQIYKNIELFHEDIKVKIEEIRVQDQGVFIIVRKNRSGRIVGSEEDKVWCQYKQTGNNTTEPKTLRNPMAMTRIHTFVLAKNLESIGLPMWVQGIVVFTHPQVELEVSLKRNSNTAVLTTEELDSFIRDYQPRNTINIEQLDKVTNWLNMLTTKEDETLLNTGS
ncbi:nuclease-related domain-containing protein (plasmid) [Paenibacillus urinalis]|uniref:Nuclease-related domain-containing protein n=1 Tax=Paenibacillus urinalis TaxID=521520 RepID=A0AAX3N9E2_9BACL|nr:MULTISPECIES: nuclease-related domain-containing protein [Paenibacillus]MCM3130493.1 NERD domain-containing protein [Paenibacillus sp. MER 78]WDH85380.1 nuclease-related domain-containing protein [Paenibacillus urinalis]WDH95182.1 nuclease-related domain-containing protein [Paenibacillus urinalis]WDI05344.1 nuclease-related domain-containing protein [Paenibacillus urinalis]